MEPHNYLQMTVILVATILVSCSVNLVHGQQRVISSCTTSMMSSFTPCANIITGSSNNGLVPSSTCCDSLRSLMSTNMDCACQVTSAGTSFFQQPFTQILALSLSQACGVPVPAQCKASASPNLPAPGPAVIGSKSPSLPPSAASPLSPQGQYPKKSLQVSKTMVVGDAYKYENLQLAEAVAPASSAMEAEAPTQTPGGRIRPVLTPLSSASRVPNLSPFAAIFLLIGINHAFLWHPSIC